ncbi:MAG TPA: hypothetical protein ENJ95_24505 [Bacteroidetes bacterium]|nr:hypothetical protein [Bacteroidota bacterium]
MKKIICITGLDGVGKSTLTDALAQQLPGAQPVNIWDLFESQAPCLPFKSKRDIDDFLCLLTPGSRLLFLAHALKYAVDTALQSDASILVMNAYFYKYFATEKALGAAADLITSLQKNFPRPDVVIQLTLPPSMAAKRKKTFSRYECGLSQKPDNEGFIAFQQKAQQAWEGFDKTGWHFLDARKMPKDLLGEALGIISQNIDIGL